MVEYLRHLKVPIVIAVILGSLWTYAWARNRTADAERGMHPAQQPIHLHTNVAQR